MKILIILLSGIIFLSGCKEKIVHLSPQEALLREEQELARDEKHYFDYVTNRLPFNTELIKAVGNYWYIVKIDFNKISFNNN
jgi:hypothetical protein